MTRILTLLKVLRFVSLLAAGLAVWNSATVVYSAGAALGLVDPAALAGFRLYMASTQAFVTEIEQAIADGDHAYATALCDLAIRHGHELPPALRDRAQGTLLGRAYQSGRRAAKGFVFGSLDSGAEIAGSVASDLIGVGDLRDFSVQGFRYLSNDGYDPILLGLSAVGLGLTVSAYGSAGATVVPDAGLSVLKSAYRSRKLSAPLTAYLSKNVAKIVDTRLLKAEFTAAADEGALGLSRLRTAAVRSVDDTAARALIDDATVLGEISTKGGMRSSVAALSLAESPKELRKLQKVATHFGDGTHAVMKFLGRSILEVGAMLYAVASALAGLSLVIGAFVLKRLLKLVLWPLRRAGLAQSPALPVLLRIARFA
ncbi:MULTISPECIES: hypothetical protein [Alphaproteobacteria]|uniref:Uncharacterized protein n=2 Tax=Alphaproteobacteria TaxID=28211 RepID=A0A512HLQ1_9HYPH|nr:MULTISPECIES: hypothetical protein [Alphaproteobacteria]GEO86373.1 hypothetical protein RNA01_33050 [Ciceribacter naphthalenivorans]GLR22251.1 hypothetical protein GCM10007920_20380 [Ciceribacter naphthalenivorans]GLT05107.1 hypothetical protein GCM10007926_20380 [Sphingomonas psychrolutea]